jgi:uncharacterized membrane protein
MMKKDRILFITTAVCLLPLILSIALYDKLPDQVAVHFNTAGEPDNYASKFFAAIGLPLIMAAINIVTHVMLDSDPRRMNASAAIKYLSKWLIPALTVILMPITLFIALGYDIPVQIIVPAFVGVIIAAIGNYLPKCKQNYTVGIKLPWTLNSEENWNRTHHMAGYLWIIGGLFLILGSCLRAPGTFLAAVIILIALIPSFYSYWLYRKGI